MAATDAKIIPRKNEAYRWSGFMLDTAGVRITGGLSGLASSISKDNGAFAAGATPIEVATNTGYVYLDLTAAQMNADSVAIIISATGGYEILIVLYPEEAGDIRVNATQIGGSVPGSATIGTVTSVTNDVGITQVGADKAWSSAARTLTRPSGAVVDDIANDAVTFETNLTESTNDYWKDVFLKFTSGPLIEQVKKITAYNGTTKFITVSGGFTAEPSAGNTFVLINK
jgi:hypothetical protein